MFRLLRYFSLASAAALMASAGALVTVYRADQLAEHTAMAEAENARMAESFATTFLAQFGPFLRIAAATPAAKLRPRGELKALDIVLHQLAGGLPIVKMKLYSPDGVIIYSTERSDIGDRSDNPAAFAAAARGRTTSVLFSRKAMTGMDGVAHDRSVVATTTPLREDGRIAGILELYSDVTAPLAHLRANILRLSTAIVATFCGLYVLLFLIVRRADLILRRQHRDLEASRAELRASEIKFRSVTQSASDAIVSIDGFGRVMAWNLGAERMFGHAAAEMLGQPVTRIIPAASRDAHVAALCRLREGLPESGLMGRTITLEGLRRDGATVPVELILSRWEMDGQPHFTAILRDVSERRRADEAVRKLSQAVEQSPVAVMITDTDGNIEYANPQFCAVTGYDREEVAGRNPRLLKSGLTPPDDYQALWRSITAGETWHGIFCNRRKDGSLFWEEATISPIKDATGRTTHFVGIKTDVTERRRKELELQRALDRLTETNAELERFAYVASHDLQEPLRSVTSFAQLLQRHFAGRLDVDGEDYIGFIVTAAKRMHALINDLLAYSRVAERSDTFVPVPTGQPCRTAIDNLREAVTATGAEISVAELPEVMADEVQLVHLFQNLLANAIKFHRPGVPPRIAVAARALHGAWEFTVADNGIGLEATSQDIFEIFRRLHPAQAYPGTGTGLAICKRVVQHHGGRIWATSEPGIGSTFHFTLAMV